MLVADENFAPRFRGDGAQPRVSRKLHFFQSVDQIDDLIFRDPGHVPDPGKARGIDEFPSVESVAAPAPIVIRGKRSVIFDYSWQSVGCWKHWYGAKHSG